MDHFQEFFLENQRDLDLKNAPKSPPRPPPECEHQWERMLINGEIPGYSCSQCGAERYARRIDDQDFEGRTYNSHSNRQPKPPPGPPCSIKTVRGHRCTHPSVSGSDKCKKHLNLFPEACYRCGAQIARGKDLRHIHDEIIAIPKFAILWSGVKVRIVGEYDIKTAKRISREPYCSFECLLDAKSPYELPPRWQAIFKR